MTRSGPTLQQLAAMSSGQFGPAAAKCENFLGELFPWPADHASKSDVVSLLQSPFSHLVNPTPGRT
jgi:hypothetical protein